MSAAPQIFADDLVIGQAFAGEAREIGDAQFADFARMTGDDHPIHARFATKEKKPVYMLVRSGHPLGCV